MQEIREFKIPNTIQSRENSKGGGMDDILYIGSVWQNPNGHRNVPYLNRNGSKRNLNLNWVEDDWDAVCRFAAVRNSLYSPPKAGFYLLNCLFQPPIILPTSINLSESSINFLLSSAFISHATCKKNLRMSIFTNPFLR